VEIRSGETARLHAVRSDGITVEIDGLRLDAELSAEIFNRTGSFRRIQVDVPNPIRQSKRPQNGNSAAAPRQPAHA
jgi:hypothetical protein